MERKGLLYFVCNNVQTLGNTISSFGILTTISHVPSVSTSVTLEVPWMV
jgi:hypothetical protein